MQWSMERLPNVKKIVDRYHLYDRTVNRNVQKMRAAGTPCTFWRNMSITEIGTFPDNVVKCYCWTTPVEGGGTTNLQVAQPDRKHFLCSGTGILDSNVVGTIGQVVGGGYQKYGYREHLFSTPTKLTKSSNNLVISGTRGSSYTLSGNSLDETLTTERLSLINFKEVDYLLVNEQSDLTQNRIEYSYSTDDVTWHSMTESDWFLSPIANKSLALTLSTGIHYVRFKIRLRKKQASSPSPQWNSIRFRYRNHYKFNEIDPIFSDIEIPAFLAGREQQATIVEQADNGSGWVTKYPLQFWVLPDAAVHNADVIKFLKGTYKDMSFETQSVKKYTYGENMQILHRDFEAKLIRDGNDLLGITKYLI